MLHLFANFDCYTNFILILALIFVLFYEAINGFHDTANAVATVIYTRALRSYYAVIMSGIFNFFGVLMGGLSVAYTIVHLLPIELIFNINSTNGLLAIFSILLSAILWNLSTWYFGLPSSSSHTLIGAIIGIGLTGALLNNQSLMQSLNFSKLIEIFISLIFSPFIGMFISAIIFLILRRYFYNTKKLCQINLTSMVKKKLEKQKPPFWTRMALIISAAGVSFSHGANDGQKGIGLIMLALTSIAPAFFAVNLNSNSYDINRTVDAIVHLKDYYIKHHAYLNCICYFPYKESNLEMIKKIFKFNEIFNDTKLVFFKSITDNDFLLVNKVLINNIEIGKLKICYYNLSQIFFLLDCALLLLKDLKNYNFLNFEQRIQARRLLICIVDSTNKIMNLSGTSQTDKHFFNYLRQDLLCTIEYAPLWIIIIVGLSLSIGTMFGWKRVMSTIGEKIGKKGMTYAQGLSAQLTTAISIGIASYTGIPVSTTHILSSAIAGTMLVSGYGVQGKTVKNIILTWVLTLPIVMFLAGILYYLAVKIFIFIN